METTTQKGYPYLVNKCGTTRAGFISLDEAKEYAKKVGGEVIDNFTQEPVKQKIIRETESFIQLEDHSIYWKENGRKLGGGPK